MSTPNEGGPRCTLADHRDHDARSRCHVERSGRLAVGGGVITVAERLYTIPITCLRDHQAHNVTDENAAAGRRTGTYEAVCGYVVLAAPLVAPAGRPCEKCTAVVASHRAALATSQDRHPRHRWRKGGGGRWGWTARMW